MHPQLHRFLAGKGDSKDSYLAVLQAIKKEGGLVVKGIDSLPATSRPYGGDTDTRDMARELAMNEYAANTIRGDKGRSKGSKYVILAGRAHSNTQKYRPNTLGMTRRGPRPVTTPRRPGRPCGKRREGPPVGSGRQVEPVQPAEAYHYAWRANHRDHPATLLRWRPTRRTRFSYAHASPRYRHSGA